VAIWLLAHSSFAAEPVAKPTPNSPVVFSTPRGFFDQPFDLKLQASDPGTVIRFTTDASEPSAAKGVEYKEAIKIAGTTVVRAAAFKGATRVSSPITHTYLFLDQVIKQSAPPPGYPNGPNAWDSTPAAYRMDPKVVGDPRYAAKIKPAMKSLPTLSIVCDREDLFGARRGIYVHTLQRGTNWARQCSVELILPDGTTAFQADAGLRVQGNASREPEKSPKHGLRLVFKKQYGPSKLEYQMFPDSPIRTFDNLILRADFNASWLHWDPSSRIRGQRTRDAWAKDTHRAMGWVAPHNRFLHLYLNGLYWGVYDATERPDGSFGADYFGGKPDEFDVVNEFQLKGGTMDAFGTLRSLRPLSNARQYAKAQTLLNMTEFADFMLLNYFGANQDFGERKNWYAVRSRTPPGVFHYIVWDAEQILYNVNDDSISMPYEVPLNLADELRNNPEFRLLFADRAQKHLFNDGALTPAPNIARWMRRANEIDTAIIAESARWGYYRKTPPFTRDVEWLTEQKRLVTDYFPKRTRIFLQQLRRAGLYPNISAPTLTIARANESAAAKFTLAADAGTEIYYTTDGSDPRLEGGALSRSGQMYKDPITVGAAKTINARSLKDGVWSALSEFPLTQSR
jgi:hypothetical protein